MPVAEAPLEILANSEELAIAGRSVRVGRLSVRKMLALGRILAPALSSVNAKDLQNAANGADWAAVTALMDDAVVAKVFGLVTDQDGDWCLDNFDLSDIVKVVEALKKHNDIGALVRVFTQAGAKSSPENSKDTSSAPSNSPSLPEPVSLNETLWSTQSSGSAK